MATNALQNHYTTQALPKMMQTRGYRNVLQAPRLTKIVINSGINTSREREAIPETVKTLGMISGQRPIVTKATKSISNFKLRQGMQVGVCVTLRGAKMYNFLYRLINIVLPRVRDFRGISPKAFDGAGNYTLGLNDQSVFTEVELDKVKHNVGMNITIVTTAKTDAEARELLGLLGMPFST